MPQNPYEEVFRAGQSPFPKTAQGGDFVGQVAAAGKREPMWIPQGGQVESLQDRQAREEGREMRREEFGWAQQEQQRRVQEQQRADQDRVQAERVAAIQRTIMERYFEVDDPSGPSTRDLRASLVNPQSIARDIAAQNQQRAMDKGLLAEYGNSPSALIENIEPSSTPMLSRQGEALEAWTSGFLSAADQARQMTTPVIGSPEYNALDDEGKLAVIGFAQDLVGLKERKELDLETALTATMEQKASRKKFLQQLEEAPDEKRVRELLRQEEENRLKRKLSDPGELSTEDLAQDWSGRGPLFAMLAPALLANRSKGFADNTRGMQNRQVVDFLVNRLQEEPDRMASLGRSSDATWEDEIMRLVGFPAQNGWDPNGIVTYDRRGQNQIYQSARSLVHKVFFAPVEVKAKESGDQKPTHAVAGGYSLVFNNPGDPETGPKAWFEKARKEAPDAYKSWLNAEVLGENVDPSELLKPSVSMEGVDEEAKRIDWQEMQNLLVQGNAQVRLPDGNMVPALTFFSGEFPAYAGKLYRRSEGYGDTAMPDSIAARTGITPGQALRVTRFVREALLNSEVIRTAFDGFESIAGELNTPAGRLDELRAEIFETYYREAQATMSDPRNPTSLAEFNRQWIDGGGMRKAIQKSNYEHRSQERQEQLQRDSSAPAAVKGMIERMEETQEMNPSEIVTGRELAQQLQEAQDGWDSTFEAMTWSPPSISGQSRPAIAVGTSKHADVARAMISNRDLFTAKKWPWQSSVASNGRTTFQTPSFAEAADFESAEGRDALWAYMATQEAMKDALQYGKPPMQALRRFLWRGPYSGERYQDSRVLWFEKWMAREQTQGQRNLLMQSAVALYAPKLIHGPPAPAEMARGAMSGPQAGMQNDVQGPPAPAEMARGAMSGPQTGMQNDGKR